MCAIQWVLLKSFIFGLCISVTEAVVVLATFDGKTTYSIGSEVELVCSITPYNNEMTWFVNNDPYADCIVGTCNPYSNKPYAFSFTFNETAGVFKLAIGSVTYSHAELSFACDDGIERKQISFNVTADKGQNNSSTTNTSNSPTKPDINNQITVTNEGNGDNDDSELSIGAIVGIVLGCVLGLPFLCVVVFAVFLLYRRKKIAEIKAILRVWIEDEGNCCILMKGLLEIEELPRIIMIETKNELSSIPMDNAIRTNIITRLNEERDEITNRLRWMEEQDDAWKLRARLDVINEEHKLMTIQELVPNESFANSIMLDLAQYETFSSFIVKKFAKREVFNLIISKLQKNTDVYKKIKIGIEKAKEDHTQMNGGD